MRKAGTFPPGRDRISVTMSGGRGSGPAAEEIRGTTSQSKSPSTNSTIDSSMSVKPGLLRIPGVDVRILAFPALHPVRSVGADVGVPVRAGGAVHVVVPPGILRYPVEVPSLPVILRDPGGTTT